MRQNKKKFILGLLVGCFFGTFVFLAVNFIASPALAQVAIGNYGATFGLGTADLASTIIKIVQWVLGFLGLIAVIMIMYGGFIWMTAAGNEERIKKAKKIIVRAVIGLLIVLLAWAIVLFIHNMVNKATSGGGQVCDPGPPAEVNGCWVCNAAGTGWNYDPLIPGCGPETETFRVRWVDPGDQETNVPLCSIIQAVFNGKVLPVSYGPNVGVYINSTNAPVAGTWQLSADETILEFLPSSDYQPNTVYRVELRAGIQEDSADPRIFLPKTWTFTTGTTTLDIPPTVTQIFPDDGSRDICLNTPIQANFSSKMRVSSINNNTVKFRDITAGLDKNFGKFGYANPQSFSTRPAELMTAGDEYTVTLIAGTPGGTCKDHPECVTKADCIGTGAGQCNSTWIFNNDGIMDICGNHLDGDYDTNDEGSAQDDFMTVNGRPSGGEVAPWNFFADTDTTNTRCIPQITGIIPDNGKYDNAATHVVINGSNFGINGNVNFYKGINDQQNCFNASQFPVNNCIDPPPPPHWTNTSINIHVPGGPYNFGGDIIPSNGAKDGPVTVAINPGVCVGGANDYKDCFVAADCPGGTCATDSNGSEFNVTSPQIKRASGLNNQAHGGIGQYVSVIRRNDSSPDAGFGAVAGRVIFRRLIDGAEMVADIPPDPPCDSTWTNDSVVIKVPDLVAGFAATACSITVPNDLKNCPTTTLSSVVGIQLEKSDGRRSNIVNFIFTNETPGPGLCKIDPTCGPIDKAITLSGEKFGTVRGSVHFNMPSKAPVATPAPTLWTDLTINTSVPNVDNADDPYEVDATKVVGGNSYTSNALPFRVPCGGIPKVVEDTTCAMHCDNTGAECTDDIQCGGGNCVFDTIPSPNPYKNDTDVCVNAITAARFTVPMDPATLTTTNIKLYLCTDNLADCLTTSEVLGTVVNVTAANSFELTRPGNLTPDQYYKMFISKDVESDPPGPDPGVKMNKDYQWVFKTKNDPGPCPVEKILVTPASVTFDTVPNSQNYQSRPIGQKCSILDPGGYDWTWASSVPLTATVAANPNPLDYTAVASLPVGALAGKTNISAATEGKTGRGVLTYNPDSCKTDQTKCRDPLRGGCGNSVCDLTRDVCTPSVTGLSPSQGPKGTTVTIDGCWFDKYQGGASKVNFGGSAPAEIVCGLYWTPRKIIVKNPLDPPGTPQVIVTTRLSLVSQNNGAADDFTLTDQCCSRFQCAGGPNAGQDCYSDEYCVPASGGSCSTCASFTNVPANGMPGLCPPIDPSTAAQGELVSIDHDSYNLMPADANPNNDLVKFNRNQDDPRTGGPNSIIGRGGNWSDDTITSIRVPDAAQSGPVKVYVDGCPSNTLDFKLKCTSHSECAGSTGCCADTDLPPDGIKECADIAYCTSGPGALCIDNTVPACAAGVASCRSGYSCRNNGDCRCCCDPGPPAQKKGSLTCMADQAPCTGGNRGLYCGCTNDDSCADPLNIGCGGVKPYCCLDRPEIDDRTPPDPNPYPQPNQTGICLNAAITVDFDQALDSASLSSDNVVVYSAEAPAITRDGAECNGTFGGCIGGCTGLPGVDAWACSVGWWNYDINFPVANTNYLVYVQSANNSGADLAPLGVYQNFKISVEDDAGNYIEKGNVKNLASQFNITGYQQGVADLGIIQTAGVHGVRVEWTNDWCPFAPAGSCPPYDSNPLLHRVGIIRGNIVQGRAQSTGSGLAFYPTQNLLPNIDYYVFLRGGARGADVSFAPSPPYDNNLGIRNKSGVFMWDADTSAEDISRINRLWRFTTGTDVCKLDHIDLSMIHLTSTGPQTIIDPGPDRYFCAADTCDDDYELVCGGTPGNQHIYFAQLKDKAGNTINSTPFNFTWSESAPVSGSVKLEDLCIGPPKDIKFLTALPNDGEERITVSASDPNPNGYGSAQTSARAIVNVCENPWPDFRVGAQYPFSDDITTHMVNNPSPYYNFQTFYCRDNGNKLLTTIKYNDAAAPNTQPIIKVNTPTDPLKDELMKEFFFMVDNKEEDVIGIRVMENKDNLSPELWYKRQFGAAAPKVEKTTVNGYPAVKQGRTVYVAAANLVEGCALNDCSGPDSCCNNGIFYTNIYLISYNDKATDETVEIYNRLLKNWTFNTNFTGDLEAFKRDLKRVNDLNDIYISILNYKTKNNTYPKLAGGTYLNYMSTSVWPSWQDTLGQDLGSSLPVDPLNTIFGCPFCMNTDASFSTDQSTGSVEVDKEGNIYFTKKEVGQNGSLLKCDSNLITCKTIRTYAVNLFPAGLYVDNNNGNILIGVRNTANVNAGSIERLDKDGNVLNTYTGLVGGDYPYRNVVDIVADYQGNYFVSFGNGNYPTGIHRFTDLSKAPTTLNFAIGAPDYAIATGLAIDTNNNVYIAIRRNPTMALGGNQIRKYNNELNILQASFGDGNEQNDADSISTPQEIDLDNSGHLFVSEHIHDRVVMMDTDLKQKLNTFGEYDVEVADKYHYRNPLGVRYDSGYLFVADSSNNRILKQKIDLDKCQACWNEITKTFQCSAGSHIYQYMVSADGSSSANLYATLEYNGPGSWINYDMSLPANDNCKDNRPSVCQCFNYRHNITGSSVDYDSPVISFVSPAIPAPPAPLVVSGKSQLVQVNVTDPSGSNITKVEFYVDGVLQFTDTDAAGGWSWIWDTTKFSDRIPARNDQPHVLKAVAYDEYGNFGAGAVNAYINNLAGADTTPPTVIITKPIDGTTISGNSVTFEAYASDASGINGIQLQVDSTLLPICSTAPISPCVRTVDTTALPNGQHTLRAVATPGAGPSGSAQITVTVDNGDTEAPVVTITNPANNSTVSGNVTVTANATDNVGVTKVEFYLDGSLQASDPASPYEWLWHTVLASNANHNLTVMAIDAKDNTGQQSFQVTVRNGVTQPLVISFVNGGVPETYVGGTPPDASPPTPVKGIAVNIRVQALPSQGALVRAKFILDGVDQFTGNAVDIPPPVVDWTWNTALWIDGIHTVRVIGYDADGRASPTIERRFTVSNGSFDLVPPVIGATAINPLSGIPNTVFTITADITDAIPGVDATTTYAHIKDFATGNELTRIRLWNDGLLGGHGDVDENDNIYTGRFNSAGYCGAGSCAYFVDIAACDLRGNCIEKENI